MSERSSHPRIRRVFGKLVCGLIGAALFVGCSSSTCPAGRKGDTGPCLAEPATMRNGATAEDADAG
jgi:hypothetical protein